MIISWQLFCTPYFNRKRRLSLDDYLIGKKICSLCLRIWLTRQRVVDLVLIHLHCRDWNQICHTLVGHKNNQITLAFHLFPRREMLKKLGESVYLVLIHLNYKHGNQICRFVNWPHKLINHFLINLPLLFSFTYFYLTI